MPKWRVGVVHWQPGDGMANDLCTTLAALGHAPRPIPPADPLPADLDLVLMWGPLGSLVPLARQLIAAGRHTRPKFILLHTEQTWNPRLPGWFAAPLSRWRAGLERRRSTVPRWLSRRALRFRYFGDLCWLAEQHLPDVLAVPSRWYAAFLAGHGFPTVETFIGSHPSWGADLRLERDIPVLWLGKPGSARRARLLRGVRAQLRARGVEMLIVDGVAHPYVFGQERTRLLNRTKIVLNLLRQPWDANAMRYFIAAPNRTMIVTEQTLAHVPFIPGVHLAACPVEQLADTVCLYLRDEPARRAIAENACRLVTTELTMANGVSRILRPLEDG
jgi:hypothetical protein